MWLAANIPPALARAALPLYVLGVAAAGGVALFGVIINGSRRWLNIGVARIQPSELMKIAMPLMLAWYFEQREGASLVRLRARRAAAAGAGPADQAPARPRHRAAGRRPGAYVIFLAGLTWKIIVGLAALGGAAGAAALAHLHDYQRHRILTLLDPTRDPLGKGFHIIQSTIAVGSGGVLGKGWMQGTQTHLDFIPERHTDFIFAVFGEEFGLIGNARAAAAVPGADLARDMIAATRRRCSRG